MIEMSDQDSNIVHSSNKFISERIHGNATNNINSRISRIKTAYKRLRMRG
jgi:hypothetical protein